MKRPSVMHKPIGIAVALVACASVAGAQSLSRNPNPSKKSSQAHLEVPLPAQTISQSTSISVVAGSVSCNSAGIHTDNSYYRGMTLSAFPVLTLPQYAIQQVTIGVELAGGGGTQPVTLATWKATANPIGGGANPPGNNQTSTDTIQVADQSLSLQALNIAAPPVYLVATEILAVEIFTPNGTPGGDSFFIGSNAAGQAAPSYIKAAPCGVAAITDLAAIGFPNMHIVMQVTGNNQVPVELQSFGIE